jgi:alkanesulfonate monooxygenase SsuD/methylene tetrahydromethanopterin reductase-like flavin-dependent oxidoreductase (luciferase family)
LPVAGACIRACVETRVRVAFEAVAVEFFLFLSQSGMSMDGLVARAIAAEAVGFVGMAGMDHLAPPLAVDQPMYEALTVNTWLAARTERLVQSQLVLCDAFRHPAVLARQAVTIDHASGGRFELGIGAGSVVEEFTTFGIEPKTPGKRVRRLSETLDILRACWAGETFDYDGEFFRIVAGRELPVPLTKIPLVIGGAGPRMLQLVAKHADWWNCMVTNRSRFDELRDQIGNARVSTQQMVAFVADEAARETIEETARRRFPFSGLIVGSGSELVDWFGDMRDRGVERFYVGFTDFAEPDTLAAFGRDVIDALS